MRGEILYMYKGINYIKGDIFMSTIASTNTQTAKQNEQYFLRAGQKYNEKTDSRIRPIFEDVDLNHNKEIPRTSLSWAVVLYLL